MRRILSYSAARALEPRRDGRRQCPLVASTRATMTKRDRHQRLIEPDGSAYRAVLPGEGSIIATPSEHSSRRQACQLAVEVDEEPLAARKTRLGAQCRLRRGAEAARLRWRRMSARISSACRLVRSGRRRDRRALFGVMPTARSRRRAFAEGIGGRSAGLRALSASRIDVDDVASSALEAAAYFASTTAKTGDRVVMMSLDRRASARPATAAP